MASLKRIGPAGAGPVSLDEAKAFLRITYDAEDALIARFLTAARERVEEETGRALAEQSWRLSAELEEARPAGPWRVLSLPRPPMRTLTSLRLVRADGASEVIGAQDLRFDEDAAELRLRLSPAQMEARRAWRPLEVVYASGYGAETPDALRTAMLLMLASAYERRDSAGAPMAAAPPGYAALIAPFRLVRL